MITEKVRASARYLTTFHDRFALDFGRNEARAHALVYVRGLLLEVGHKNVERIALRFATTAQCKPADQNEVVAMQ